MRRWPERSKASQIHSLFFFFEGNARVRPVPSQPRSRPDPVEGAARALPHELGSNSELRGSKRRVAWRWHSSTGPKSQGSPHFLLLDASEGLVRPHRSPNVGYRLLQPSES